MQRITITMDDDLAAELDAFIGASGAFNRSEAIRDLVRRGLAARGAERREADCLGVLSYAIDHSLRDLGRRVPLGRLERHDETVAALSVPVDHTTTVDVVVMRGTVASVGDYAESLFLERGVRHGALALVPVERAEEHRHDDESRPHVHLRVQDTF
ncbi:MAG: nickel-responsive transcriptional regulator NikR [Rhodovulum sulfidophilum]|uniref:Nickel-responsive transcriptional regulator NikR n=1 Tax=Rhodovulum sulfidophilum TaxID=35806 RepID=A0A2W5ND01_RHOSU|nr:MAG: nickel-responsive transcriptional regulator NikR [Rhodovulum sulfidophilum]